MVERSAYYGFAILCTLLLLFEKNDYNSSRKPRGTDGAFFMDKTSNQDNQITWHCRHCKKHAKRVKFSRNKWPLCYACYENAYMGGKFHEA